MSAEKIPLSGAIITKNEEKRLPDCLRSLSFAGEVVVVDCGSTDRTVEIAGAFGCRVFVEDWKGDGPQKNSAVAKCTHEWVLVIDADERVPQETREVIEGIVTGRGGAEAYSFPRKNFFHGRWIRHGGWWPDRIIRLVQKSKGRFEAITHGKWVTRGEVKDLTVPLEHYSFADYAHMLKVMEGRSTDMAREMYAAGRRAGPVTPFSHGLAMFLKVYVLRLGFLDGLDGFVIALTRAGGTFFKYAKLLELQRENRE